MEIQTCLRPDCGRPAKVRGLCAKCYGCARNAVATKKTTWSALVKAGKVLAAKSKGNALSDATRWFLAL